MENPDRVFTRLYLVRHGQTAWNVKKLIQGNLDNIPLNENGIQQANAVAERIKNEYPVDAVFASGMLRAQQTAQAIGDKFDIPIVVDSNLNEVDFGKFAGSSIYEIESKFPEYFQAFRHFILTNRQENTQRPTLPDGESIAQIEKRVQAFVQNLLNEHGGKHVVAVSHGSFLKCMMTYFSGQSLENYMPYWFENTAISIVDFFGDLPVIRRLNDTGHINKPLEFVIPRII